MAEPAGAPATIGAPEFSVDRHLWRTVGIAAAVGLGIGLALVLLAHLVGAHPSTTLTVGLPMLVSVLLQLIRASFNEMAPTEQRPVQPVASTNKFFMKLRQLERRLQGASLDPAKFEWNVRPMLVELVTDRLRYKHRVSIQREPERARAIIGEQLWLIMDRPTVEQSPAPSEAQLKALVAAIEAI
ncbi:MAG: hypothetical protein ACR2N4_00975 [Jatrophihabitans sp.]